MEFAQLAILAAAAGAGDREAQADILFMLIDKDHNQTIEYHELERFCRNAARWGILDGDPQRACEEVWSDASGYGNGIITQAQFRKVASRFRPVELPAPLGARGAEWRELVEKHKEHYFREEKEDRRYHGYARGWRGGGGYGGGYGGGGQPVRAVRRCDDDHTQISARATRGDDFLPQRRAWVRGPHQPGRVPGSARRAA